MDINNLVTFPMNSLDYRSQRIVCTDYCSSSGNEYVPICTFTDGEVLTNRRTQQKRFIYRVAMDLRAMAGTGRVSGFCNHLLTGLYWMRISNVQLLYSYYGASGTIVWLNEQQVVVPLMAMCVRREYLFSFSRTNINPDHLCLIVDQNLIEDENHFKLFRNVNRLYIEPVKKFVDVLYTRDIKRVCLNSPKLTLPKVKTITELQNSIQEVNQIVLAGLQQTI